MRSNKLRKKSIIFGVIGLSTVSLIAVGFASWTMNGSLPDSANVVVNVGEITDHTLIVDIDESINGSDLSFAFDNSKISNLGNGDSKTEDLEFKVAYRLESTRTINTSNYVLKFSFDSKTKTNYGALNSGEDKFVITSCVTTDFSFSLPEENQTIKNVEEYVVTTITYDADYMGATVNTTFKFAWGESFNGENPGLYYDDDDDISVYKDLATKLKRFGELSQNLGDVNLTITPEYSEGVN